ncbi:MAG: hypothetical protein AABY87_08875 [bacterium]
MQHPSSQLKGQKIQIKQALNGDLLFSVQDKIYSVKEISGDDLQRSKEARPDPTRKIKQKDCHPKSKKSWMDEFYFGHPKVTLVK